MINEDKYCPNCGSIMKKALRTLNHTMVSSATDYRPEIMTSGQKNEIEMWECTNPYCRVIVWS